MKIVYDAKRKAGSSKLKLKKAPFILLLSVDPQALLLLEGEFKSKSLNNPQSQHQWRDDADLYTPTHTHAYIFYLFIYFRCCSAERRWNVCMLQLIKT